MKLINRYGFLIILIILSLFFPQSLSNHAKLTMRVIITGFAVDKSAGEYEVTAQAVIPSPSIQGGSGEAKIDFISEKGKSVSDCVNKIAYKIGKTDALSHTNFILLGEGVIAENIISQLDYFDRSEKLADNILVLVTDGNAKEMIKKTKDLDMTVAVSMQRLFLDKEQNINGLMNPVIMVYNSEYTESKCLVLSGLNIQDENKESETGGSGVNGSSSGGSSGVSLSSSGGVTGGSENSGESSGGGSSSDSNSQGGAQGGESSGKGQARIDFLNHLYLFRNGNLISKITDKEAILGYYMTLPNSKYGDISFSFIDKDFDEVQMGLNIREKKVNYKYEFINNKPVVSIHIVVDGARIYEITDAHQGNNGLFYEEDNESIKHYQKEIENYIVSIIEKVCKQSQDIGFDLFNTADNLNKYDDYGWDSYHTIMGDNGYVGNIEYNISCEVNNLY